MLNKNSYLYKTELCEIELFFLHLTMCKQKNIYLYKTDSSKTFIKMI